MRWLILLVVVAVLAYVFLGNGETEQKTAAPPQTETAAPAPPPAESAPAAPAQPAAPPAAPGVNSNVLASRMQTAARQTGVELRGLQVQPGNVLVFVAWKGGNAALGGDFIQECIRQGVIRDFNANNVKMGMEMPNGEMVNTAQYQVYLP